MPHLWLRAEQRSNEQRVGLTPAGAKALIDAGISLTVEACSTRVFQNQSYVEAGAKLAAENSWPAAPTDAIIFGLKELPDDGTALSHRHIMFGHAYKGQAAGQSLLQRFKAGGGVLYDLEYLLDDSDRRLAAFGYWAGFAGAAVSLKAWAAQQRQSTCEAVSAYPNKHTLFSDVQLDLSESSGVKPRAIVVGALGRVGNGVIDLCHNLDLDVTGWDTDETSQGGPFPEILDHDVFFNCVLADARIPMFVPDTAKHAPRRLSVIGDIACDPDSPYNPVAVYDRVTSWQNPVTRVHNHPALDVMAIDNLPSLLPLESSEDFSAQLLPSLLSLNDLDQSPWKRAREFFRTHSNL